MNIVDQYACKSHETKFIVLRKTSLIAKSLIIDLIKHTNRFSKARFHESKGYNIQKYDASSQQDRSSRHMYTLTKSDNNSKLANKAHSRVANDLNKVNVQPVIKISKYRICRYVQTNHDQRLVNTQPLPRDTHLQERPYYLDFIPLSWVLRRFLRVDVREGIAEVSRDHFGRRDAFYSL